MINERLQGEICMWERRKKKGPLHNTKPIPIWKCYGCCDKLSSLGTPPPPCACCVSQRGQLCLRPCLLGENYFHSLETSALYGLICKTNQSGNLFSFIRQSVCKLSTLWLCADYRSGRTDFTKYVKRIMSLCYPSRACLGLITWYFLCDLLFFKCQLADYMKRDKVNDIDWNLN